MVRKRLLLLMLPSLEKPDQPFPWGPGRDDQLASIDHRGLSRGNLMNAVLGQLKTIKQTQNPGAEPLNLSDDFCIKRP